MWGPERSVWKNQDVQAVDGIDRAAPSVGGCVASYVDKLTGCALPARRLRRGALPRPRGGAASRTKRRRCARSGRPEPVGQGRAVRPWRRTYRESIRGCLSGGMLSS